MSTVISKENLYKNKIENQVATYLFVGWGGEWKKKIFFSNFFSS